MANTHMSRSCSRERLQHSINAITCKRKSMGFNADSDRRGGGWGNLMLTSNIAPCIACADFGSTTVVAVAAVALLCGGEGLKITRG